MKKPIKKSKSKKPKLTTVSKVKRGNILCTYDGKGEFLVLFVTKSAIFKGDYTLDVRCVKGKELDEVVTGQLIDGRKKVLVKQ